MNSGEIQEEALRKKLEGEAGPVDWKVLRPHLLRDAVVVINSSLDLIEVGIHIACDDTEQVGRWISEGNIRKPLENEIASWEKEEEDLRALVIAPYVIVQQLH